MNSKVFFTKLKGKIGSFVFDCYDLLVDYRICGCSLVRHVPTPWRESKGSTSSTSTHYHSLKVVFENEEFSADDRFIDVGCAKGRVLAYMISAGYKGAFTGIEHNPEVAEYGKRWVERKHYSNVSILCGDAFAIDYNQYDKLSLARSFMPWAFKDFVKKLELELTHPIKLYYWFDQESGGYLRNRPGWKMLKRGCIFKKFGLPLHIYPQGCSVWVYEPEVHN